MSNVLNNNSKISIPQLLGTPINEAFPTSLITPSNQISELVTTQKISDLIQELLMQLKNLKENRENLQCQVNEQNRRIEVLESTILGKRKQPEAQKQQPALKVDTNNINLFPQSNNNNSTGQKKTISLPAYEATDQSKIVAKKVFKVFFQQFEEFDPNQKTHDELQIKYVTGILNEYLTSFFNLPEFKNFQPETKKEVFIDFLARVDSLFFSKQVKTMRLNNKRRIIQVTPQNFIYMSDVLFSFFCPNLKFDSSICQFYISNIKAINEVELSRKEENKPDAAN